MQPAANTSSSRFYPFLIFILGIGLSVMPLFVTEVGGDIAFQFVMIRCFAEQFWQGDLYPYWCFAANDNLGAPAFIIYFPVAFYATSLLYPLTWLGLDIYHLYSLALLFATGLTCLTAFIWLREIVSPERALMAALLFLFVPYRMEAMYFRSAFAEAWGMIWIPLVFMYARRIAQGRPGVLGYGLSLGGLAITHVPLTAVAGVFSALYLLIMKPQPLSQALRRFAGGATLAFSLAAFYLVPAIYYKSFTFDDRVFTGKISWANSYLTMENITVHNQVAMVISVVLSILLLIALSVVLLKARRRFANNFLSREVDAMACMFMMAVFLLLPISAPFYELTRPLSNMLLPWRVQVVFVLCFAYFMALIMQYLLPAKQLKTWRTDFIILMCFMSFASYLNVGVRNEESLDIIDKSVRLSRLSPHEYRSRWTDLEHIKWETIKKRARTKHPPQAAIIKGTGKVEVTTWGWDGITLKTNSTKPITLRLDHHYFPIWKTTTEGTTLSPEDKSGLMLLSVPAGTHEVRIVPCLVNGNPPLLTSALLLSALSALGVGLYIRKKRLNRVSAA